MALTVQWNPLTTKRMCNLRSVNGEHCGSVQDGKWETQGMARGDGGKEELEQ
jgi:hypothetical protein